uniref:Protein JTB n=1 Tax=Strigamia maritima TaxID=126957 RepID=T1JET1_STRMM
MIELCTRKRMLILVIVLIGVSLLALGFETFLTSNSGHSNTGHSNSIMSPNTSKNACWINKDVKIIKECQQCSTFDMNVKVPACLPTGYREQVHCIHEDEDVWRSCDRLPWLEKRNFWLFESTFFVLGLFSGFVTYQRQRLLNRRTLERIQKQISAGV